MKVLFISHDAHRAGAQLLLLEYLSWLRTSSNIEYELILLGPGVLESKYRQLCKVHSIYSNNGMISKFVKLLRTLLILKKINAGQFDLIYSNTAMNGKFLINVRNNNIPIVTHVHEAKSYLNAIPHNEWVFLKSRSLFFIAVSNSVRHDLISRGVSNFKIKVIYEFINELESRGKELFSLRRRLGIDIDSFVVGGCGVDLWRKGKDLFIPLANGVLSHFGHTRSIHFVWIGGCVSSEIQKFWDQSEYKDKIHFVSELPNASSYFSEFNIFALLSREDPFPLVNLESAISNVPILAFQGSGGSEEFLSNWPLQIIPFEDLEAYSARIIQLINDPNESNRLGKEMGDHAKLHFMIERQANNLLEVMHEAAHLNKIENVNYKKN